MRFLSSIIAITFFIIFYIWGTWGNFFIPFTIYFPTFHVIFIIVFIILTILYRKNILHVLYNVLLKYSFYIFPLFSFIFSLYVSLFILEGIPHVQDAFHYLFIAENLLEGRFSQLLPDHYEFFDYIFMMVDKEKYYSLFMPGFSFFLTPFVLLKIPFAANPLLTALNIYLSGKISEKLFNKHIAFITLILLSFSPFIIFMGSSFMPHAFTSFLLLLSFYLIITLPFKHNTYYFVGFLAGWLMISRPQSFLFSIIPFAIAIYLFSENHRSFLESIFKIACLLLPWVGFLLFYNYHFTSSPFTFIQNIYFNMTEPVSDCHHLGFNTGCPYTNSLLLSPDGFQFKDAFKISFYRLSPFLTNTFTHPLIFIFLPLSLLLPRLRIFEKHVCITASFFLFFVFGYFFFYFHGNVFGPRYYYDATFFLLISLSSAIFYLSQKLLSFTMTALVIPAFITTIIIFTSYNVIPSLCRHYESSYWGVDNKLKETIEKENIKNSLIFIDSFYSLYKSFYGTSFTINNITDYNKSKNIVVHDLGDEANAKIMHYYPNRSYFKAQYNPFDKNSKTEIYPVTPLFPPSHLFIDFETKYISLNHSPDFCNTYPFIPQVAFHVSVPNNLFQKDYPWKGLICRFTDVEQSYIFLQYATIRGTYSGYLTAIKGPDMGSFNLIVNNEPILTIELQNDIYKYSVIPVQLNLNKGNNLIEFRPTSLKHQSHFILDYLRLDVQPIHH